MGADKGLNDFLQILKSPEIYPDIAGAGFFMSPFLGVASKIVAYAGMVALIFVVLRIAADVVMMSGAGSLVTGDKASANLRKFTSAGIEDCIGDPWKYVKTVLYKIILMLAFIGLMISGHILPLAGTATATIGAVISKASNINPVPYIDALDLSLEGVQKSINKSSISTLMKEYNRHAGNMLTAKQQADKSENISENEYYQAAGAYFNSYYSAELYRIAIEGTLHNLKIDAKSATADKNKILSKEEETLRTFHARGHLADVDNILLNKGATGGADGIYKGDDSLKTEVTTKSAKLETAISSKQKYE